MKRTFIVFISVLLLASAGAAAAKGPAVKGPASKVTGEFTHGSCQGCVPGDVLAHVSHKMIAAHEATGKRPQRGFLLGWTDSGRWYEMDFNDTSNTCVNVYAEGRVRTGGLASAGNGPQVGRYFGLDVLDGGEPAYFADYLVTVRFSLDYWSEDARLAFLDWCESGELPAEPLNGQAIWPSVVIRGNLQVHSGRKR
jgi:hypothetical protein